MRVETGFRRFIETRIKPALQNRRIVWLVAILALGLVGLLFFSVFWGNSGSLTPATVLRLSTLELTVEADGLVESAHKYEIHAPSSLKVSELYVKEGDSVRAGDLLALLDTEALSMEIQRAELSIQSAETNMTSEQTALANSVTSARNAVASADLALQAAKREYASLLSRQGVEPAVELASVNLDAAQRAHAYNLSLFEIGSISREILTQSENALHRAQTAYDDALHGADASLDRAREALDGAEIRLKTANDTLLDAIAKNTDPAAIALELQRVTLRERQLRLRDASIVAPGDGVVTLVNAKVGAPASGLLFIVEDNLDVLVRARVGEADIASVALDARCIITPIGQEQPIKGRVSLLPVAAERDATGAFSAVVGDDAYFIVEAVMDGAAAGVFIGMNVKVSIVVDMRDACFAVPSGLIQQDGVHRWVLARGFAGRLIEMPVEIGLETRRLTEIIGDSLYEGLELYSGHR